MKAGDLRQIFDWLNELFPIPEGKAARHSIVYDAHPLVEGHNIIVTLVFYAGENVKFQPIAFTDDEDISKETFLGVRDRIFMTQDFVEQYEQDKAKGETAACQSQCP